MLVCELSDLLPVALSPSVLLSPHAHFYPVGVEDPMNGREVRTAEILYMAKRVLAALKQSDPDHFDRIWNILTPGSRHTLFRNIGGYRIECDNWGWVTVTTDDRIYTTLFKGKFIINPYMEISSVIQFQRDRIFSEVMPLLDRVLVLEDLSEVE